MIILKHCKEGLKKMHRSSLFIKWIKVWKTFLLPHTNCQVSRSLSLSLSLSLKGFFLYTVGILLHVEWCNIQLWCSSIIFHNTTSNAHNHHTDILISLLNLLNIQTSSTSASTSTCRRWSHRHGGQATIPEEEVRLIQDQGWVHGRKVDETQVQRKVPLW